MPTTKEIKLYAQILQGKQFLTRNVMVMELRRKSTFIFLKNYMKIALNYTSALVQKYSQMEAWYLVFKLKPFSWSYGHP